MRESLTFKALKTQIERGSYIDKDDVIQKMDIFLIGNRISQSEYNTLMRLLNTAK